MGANLRLLFLGIYMICIDRARLAAVTPCRRSLGSMFAVLRVDAKKNPVYRYGVKGNMEMCTEALGCEFGGIDPAADDVDKGVEQMRRRRWSRWSGGCACGHAVGSAARPGACSIFLARR